ncbi:MAG: hypothetical protein ACYTGC_02870 [Planctomycetota bacterium]|jgi:hypothetical protein
MGLWLYVVGAVLVFLVNVVAIYCAWWALFRDRSRGRRRCPRCWHDLSRTPGMTCSECGFTAGRELHFFRTRRRWGVAISAIGICVGLAGWLYWQLSDQQLVTYLPTRLLVVAMPYAGGANGQVYQELSARSANDMLDSRQWAALLRRCRRGDWWARPVDADWRRKYGPFIRAGRFRIANRDDLEWNVRVFDSLLTLPAEVQLSTRAKWPVGVTPHFTFQMDDWWPIDADCRITITPTLEQAEGVTFFRSAGVQPWSGYAFTVPGLEPADDRVTFDLTIERELPPEDDTDGPSTWTTMSEQEVQVAMRFVDPAEIALTPEDGRALTRAVRSTFPGAVQYTSGPTPVRVWFNGQYTAQPQFAGVAVGAHVDLLRGDQLARRLDIWWLAAKTGDDRCLGWEVAMEDEELLKQVGRGSNWRVRITGSRELALRAGDAKRYWRGRIDYPLSVGARNQVAPAPPWRDDKGAGD